MGSNLDPRPFIPTSDDEWVGKDTRLLSNKQWIAYKAHKRVSLAPIPAATRVRRDRELKR
jgi:hypothetical protein